MNYIIFDLEATCWEGWDKSQNETIEIGAVLVNDRKEIISEFEQFVRPLKHPVLSDFCKDLTSITQSDVDNAPYFGEAIEKFKKWFNNDEEYVLCSWGFYDKKQLESDCEIHGLNADWVEKHISLKHQYGKFKKLRRAIGMKNALLHEKMNLEGTHHRGIDDARNIAKIFIKYFEEWEFRK
ncbi:exonuclease domain-containing protein [Aureisphaera galaxeae]|uniref:3'-5' exonuclease n=1 Tax=Aureisphaera galaxeae TaxID=1538023 RepID=UPI002350B25B|nr:3'-5' exonuclease [Aureisphaera galaxeae]MDC8003660.1 exonuclease domain-containing protein [Aureisphaera galaxeae]